MCVYPAWTICKRVDVVADKLACDDSHFLFMLHFSNRSRKCLDSNGKITIFAVKKDSDQTFLWKATIRIACVKCDPQSNKIESYKLINLKQFLKVFNTFQSHLEVMSSCEEQNDKVCFTAQTKCDNISSTILERWHFFFLFHILLFWRRQARQLSTLLTNVTELSPIEEQARCDANRDVTECCICLDRKPDLILPCTHVFCSACIEKWNATHKKCPICQEKLNSTDDSWVLSELPRTDEVNDKILTELMDLTKPSDKSSDENDDEYWNLFNRKMHGE